MSIKLDLIQGSELVTGQVANLAVQQGATYKKLSLNIPGDKTTGQWRGQIRTDYASVEGSTVLAEFTFNVSPFEPETGKTLIQPIVSATDTDLIPPTFNAGKNLRNVVNNGYYVYDFEYEETGGDVDRVYEGFLEVTPTSTQDVTP